MNERTRVTRPDLSTTKADEDVETTEVSTEKTEDQPEADEPTKADEPKAPFAAEVPKTSVKVSGVLQRPFRVDNATVVDSGGRKVCYAGMEQLSFHSRCELANWIAEQLNSTEG